MTTALYETDFYRWALRQADLLRHEEYAALDIANLIEEIEDMGHSKCDALESHLEVLLRHLLKLSGRPDGNPARGWRLTVKEQRQRINRLLRKNPSLRNQVSDLISDVYLDAGELATDELATDDLAGDVLPVHCPWTPEQILDLNWLP